MRDSSERSVAHHGRLAGSGLRFMLVDSEPGSLVGAFVTVDLAAWRRDDHASRTRRHHSRRQRARFAGRAAGRCSAELAVATAEELIDGRPELGRYLWTDPRDVGCARAMEMLHITPSWPSPAVQRSSVTQASPRTYALAACAVKTSRGCWRPCAIRHLSPLTDIRVGRPPTACTTRLAQSPTTSSTGTPGPPTGSASPASTRTSPKPSSGTTPSGPAGSVPRKTSWSASSLPRPDWAAGRGHSDRNPNEPGSTSPGPLGPRSPRSPAAPPAAAHLDQAVRTGTGCCCYSPPNRQR